MSTPFNPYAPPKTEVTDVHAADSQAEEIRRAHIRHEASVRSVGALYYLGGGLMFIAAAGLLAAGATDQLPTGIILGIIYLVLSVLSVAVARGLRAFRPWARTTGVVLSCLGLLGFPIGTLINGYILYLLLSQKGRRIFEPDYPDVVAATPHVIYRTPMLVWALVALLLLALVAAVLIPLIADR